MKYDFFEIIGVNKDANNEQIIEAFNKKCRELENSKDIKLWNFLLRSASKLGIKYVKTSPIQLLEVDPKFYEILGLTRDSSREQIIEELKEKYSYLSNEMDVKLWNFLHREASKLGIDINKCFENETKLRIYGILGLPDTSTEEEIESAFTIAWEKARLLPINDRNAKYTVELYSSYQEYLRSKQDVIETPVKK